MWSSDIECSVQGKMGTGFEKGGSPSVSTSINYCLTLRSLMNCECERTALLRLHLV